MLKSTKNYRSHSLCAGRTSATIRAKNVAFKILARVFSYLESEPLRNIVRKEPRLLSLSVEVGLNGFKKIDPMLLTYLVNGRGGKNSNKILVVQYLEASFRMGMEIIS